MTFKDQERRAEAWRRYAFRLMDRALEAEARWRDAEMYAIRSESEIRNEAIREMEREAREDSRRAFSDGYWKAKEEDDERGY